MLIDLLRRLLVVAFLAICIGMLFIGTSRTFAKDVATISSQHLLLWPTEGTITDTFGTRGGKHFGIDIAAPKGQPVVAVASGVVKRSYYSHSYGHVIFIEHDNGMETVYAHLHERYVSEDEQVFASQPIGTVGNTGRSTGNHLHFEVHDGQWNIKKSNSIDPLLVLGKAPDYFVYNEEKLAIATINEAMVAENEKSGEEIVVTIKKGDTLSHFAREYEVTVEQLQEWNGLTSDLIKIDDTLIIKLPNMTDEDETVTTRGGQLSIQSFMKNNKSIAGRIFSPEIFFIKAFFK